METHEEMGERARRFDAAKARGDYPAMWANCLGPARSEKRKMVELYKNEDSWTARIFSTTFSGTREKCVEWLRANNEFV